NVDCKTIIGSDGSPLSGDMAARILDIAGVVLNRNTIPGDKSALSASGIRYGTPWITQRGFKEGDILILADAMADLLLATKPYAIETRKGDTLRAKVDFDVLEDVKFRIRGLAEKAGFDIQIGHSGYPHFFFLDDRPAIQSQWAAFDIQGRSVRSFVNYVFASDCEILQSGNTQPTSLFTPKGKVEGWLTCQDDEHFRFTLPFEKAGLAATWLRELSDGYVVFDEDPQRRIPGPIRITETSESVINPTPSKAETPFTKPYFIGIDKASTANALPSFTWDAKESENLRRTPLYEVHRQQGAKVIPFAGWEMPVWYTTVVEEHLAVRQAAGLFDVAHMGVYQAEGADAAVFLDSVCGNEISALKIGESLYTHFLDPQANVIDDLLVYRRAAHKFLVVVNASNDDKDWAWLNAVRDGLVMVENSQQAARAFGRQVILRNLRDPKEGADMKVDIALQGPKSRDILLGLGVDAKTRSRIMALKRTELCEAVVGGINLVVSRTGYTGEKMAFELFVHPDQAVSLWNGLMQVGQPLGLKPCGLGARDSLRTEAGLPLYGHEMGGELNLGVAEAGFGAYVKTYKPWFIGRAAFLQREKTRHGIVIRFRFTEKGVRMAHLGDPVIDRKGRTVGVVTSCAVDSEGFLTGQAFVETKSAEEGTPLLIYQSAPANAGKPPAELKTGDRVLLPAAAVVISRFPK
ncbi:MAG: glycine cleavage system aminomethyltransferase GcvT, partial [Chloroflexota bacterium]